MIRLTTAVANRLFLGRDLFVRQSSPALLIKMINTSSNEGNVNKIEVPPLPVPQLESTLSKYLKSVRPLLNKEQFAVTTNVVNKFAKTEAPELHKLLEKRAKEHKNWLENWWLNSAYLEYRDPVVLFSSPGLVFPNVSFGNELKRLQYTASLISAALAFNSILESNAISQEMAGRDPLDMGQYYKVFGTSRIPLALRDSLEFKDQLSPPDNIVVIVNNNIFSIKVLDDNRNVLPTDVILGSLIDLHGQSRQPGVPVGVLTTEHRDKWARTYSLLLRKGQQNLNTLREIDRALFVVCLDKPLPKNARNEESHISKILLHGGGYSSGNSANRWFDKTIQFVIGARSDGYGITYEHSPAEGNPIGVLADFVQNKLKIFKPTEPALNYPKALKLEFEIDGNIEDAIQQAGENIDKLSSDLDVFGFKFNHFGKNQLKVLKTSPDSFIQIAIQYAFFKVHGKPAAQYESATLRKFIGGRTDVIRTCSEEALAFCQSKEKPAEKLSLLKSALAAHKAYVNDAISCRGVDRHLLGLKLIAKENGLPIPRFYSDKGYTASTYFQLSTSNVPTKGDGFMIYAPLVGDGYACCYNPRDDNINFGTSAWHHCEYTDVAKFQAALVEALLEMRDTLATELQTKSKL